MQISDCAGAIYEMGADRLSTVEKRDYPGQEPYRLYLRRQDLGRFLRSGEAGTIPVYETRGEPESVYGQFTISLRPEPIGSAAQGQGQQLAIAGWKFSREATARIREWAETNHVQLAFIDLTRSSREVA